MENYLELKQKMAKKWAMLIFGYITLTSLYLSLFILWANN